MQSRNGTVEKIASVVIYETLYLDVNLFIYNKKLKEIWTSNFERTSVIMFAVTFSIITSYKKEYKKINGPKSSDTMM